MDRSIYLGWEPREAKAFAVARNSLKRRLTQPIPVFGLVLENLIEQGLYTRPIDYQIGFTGQPVMWDVISQAPMSTQHACARFLAKELAQTGWVLFCDGDVLFRENVARIFEGLNPEKAVYCVQHSYEAIPGVKMDGQLQTAYNRKNWSSVMLLNCDHKSNKNLTVDLINSIPGRELHAFTWIKDDEIGALDPAWNYLVGESDPSIDPRIVHFTSGLPDMPGYHNVEYAAEWNAELLRWAA